MAWDPPQQQHNPTPQSAAMALLRGHRVNANAGADSPVRGPLVLLPSLPRSQVPAPTHVQPCGAHTRASPQGNSAPQPPHRPEPALTSRPVVGTLQRPWHGLKNTWNHLSTRQHSLLQACAHADGVAGQHSAGTTASSAKTGHTSNKTSCHLLCATTLHLWTSRTGTSKGGHAPNAMHVCCQLALPARGAQHYRNEYSWICNRPSRTSLSY
jgi:hypothetical protein